MLMLNMNNTDTPLLYKHLPPPRWSEKDLGNNTSTIFLNFILKMLLNTTKI